MLNISSTQPVLWPAAPASGAAPVSAVAAVTPVQSSARDAQAGLSQGREQPVPVFQRRGGGTTAEARQDPNMPEAAPLLPRESPDTPDGQPSPEEVEAQAKAKAQAEEKPPKLPLQDVLSNVWKASAAVVDVVLGRDAGGAESADPAAATAENSRAVAVEATGLPVVLPANRGAAANDAAPGLAPGRFPQEVRAYDAQGNSSWAPLEAGSLLSRRV